MIRLVRWHELTPIQQADFGNGCGVSWMPNWLTSLFFGWFFEASCRRHDFGYVRGGTENDRVRVDLGFLRSMWRDVALATLVLRPFLYGLSIVFFLLVVLFGPWRFRYGPPLALATILFYDSHRGNAENES